MTMTQLCMPVFNVRYFRFAHSEFTTMKGDPGPVPESFKAVDVQRGVLSHLFFFQSSQITAGLYKGSTLYCFGSSRPQNTVILVSHCPPHQIVLKQVSLKEQVYCFAKWIGLAARG